MKYEIRYGQKTYIIDHSVYISGEDLHIKFAICKCLERTWKYNATIKYNLRLLIKTQIRTLKYTVCRLNVIDGKKYGVFYIRM